MAPHPLVGKPAPSITLPNAYGETWQLSPGASGVPIALFFYPKSGTYGCTREACHFRDAIIENQLFVRTQPQVIGVSSDPVDKQRAFAEKHKLTYPVLSDVDGEARKAYSVGKGLFGLSNARVTFVIDSKGIVRDVLDATLNFSAHIKFVTKCLDKIEQEENKAHAIANEVPPEPQPETEVSAQDTTTAEPTSVAEATEPEQQPEAEQT